MERERGLHPLLAGGCSSSHLVRPLFAHELVHDLCAQLAFHVAAPVELAVAALSLHRLELVVPPAAAHEFAAVHALRGLIAKAALGAQGPGALVAHAVVGAGIDVDQVVDGGRVEAAVDLHQLAPAVEFHGGSAIVFLLQGIAYLAEIGKLQPTGLQATGTRDAVALAGHVGQVVHSLEEPGRESKKDDERLAGPWKPFLPSFPALWHIPTRPSARLAVASPSLPQRAGKEERASPACTPSTPLAGRRRRGALSPAPPHRRASRDSTHTAQTAASVRLQSNLRNLLSRQQRILLFH